MANGGLWIKIGVYSQKRNAGAPRHAPARPLRAQAQNCGTKAAWLCSAAASCRNRSSSVSTSSAAAVVTPSRSRTGRRLCANWASQAPGGPRPGPGGTRRAAHAAADIQHPHPRPQARFPQQALRDGLDDRRLMHQAAGLRWRVPQDVLDLSHAPRSLPLHRWGRYARPAGIRRRRSCSPCSPAAAPPRRRPPGWSGWPARCS